MDGYEMVGNRNLDWKSIMMQITSCCHHFLSTLLLVSHPIQLIVM